MKSLYIALVDGEGKDIQERQFGQKKKTNIVVPLKF